MTDIVERLRELEQVERELAHECDCSPETTVNWTYAETCQNAADEIERLRAALRMIAGNLHTGWQSDTARDALDGQPALGKVEPHTDSRYNNAERIFGDD